MSRSLVEVLDVRGGPGVRSGLPKGEKVYQKVPAREHIAESDYKCPYCRRPAQVLANHVRVLHVRGCWLGDYLRSRGIIPRNAKYGKAIAA